MNGVPTVNEESKLVATVATRNSSYSITSLLSEDRDRASTKRSPCTSPSHSYNSVTSLQPAAEDKWYSESVDRLRSIELSVSTLIYDATLG